MPIKITRSVFSVISSVSFRLIAVRVRVKVRIRMRVRVSEG
jgi:hypothetical protein